MQYFYRVGLTCNGKFYETHFQQDELISMENKEKCLSIVESFVKGIVKCRDLNPSKIEEIRLFRLDPIDSNSATEFVGQFVLELLYAAENYAKLKEEISAKD